MKTNLTFGEMLDLTTKEMRKFLQRFKDQCKTQDKWWENYVERPISSLDLQNLRDKGVQKLDILDLSMMLRVMKFHWGSIQYDMNLSKSDKHLIVEMQAIRNKNAHRDGTSESLRDQHRTLDTVHRFLELISADPDTINKVKTSLDEIMREITGGSNKTSKPESKKPTAVKFKTVSFPSAYYYGVIAHRVHSSFFFLLFFFFFFFFKGH